MPGLVTSPCGQKRDLFDFYRMGWLWGSSKPEQPTVASRQDRQVCWESRDAYFDCLDKASVIKAGDEGTICSAQKADYEKNCAKSWVCPLSIFLPFTPSWPFSIFEIDYFNQRRILAERQKHLLAQMNSQAEEAKTKPPKP